MRVEIINTGTELLLGQVVNTHLAYLAERLFEMELRVERQVCVPDGEPIREALKEAFGRCEVVLMTGGLGPTSDDVSREITADLFGLEMELNEGALQRIEKRFARRGIEMKPENRWQAMAPVGSTVLQNDHGTAPGLYLSASEGRPHVFLLPGPPRELTPMFEDQVAPMLKEIVGVQEERVCRNYRLFGVGESNVAAALEETLDAMEALEHGYCARSGEVDLRCIAAAEVLVKIDALVGELYPEELVSTDDASLPEVVVRLLKARGETFACAESCTGGTIANLVTNVSGASEVFIEGAVTYANEAKTRMLDVSAELIAEHGAVSEPVARAMAEGCLARSGASHVVTTTGIAGPTGGTKEKPVGTVFLGLASVGGETEVAHLCHPNDRLSFKGYVGLFALDLVRRRIR